MPCKPEAMFFAKERPLTPIKSPLSRGDRLGVCIARKSCEVPSCSPVMLRSFIRRVGNG